MLSFIVSISGVTPIRLKNFMETLDCLHLQHGRNFRYRKNNDYEIVIVEQVCDGIQYWDSLAKSLSNRYVKIADPVFSLPWAYNVGARVAKGDLLAFIAADMTCGPDYVDAILKQFSGNFAAGWNEGIFLGQNGTKHYYETHELMPDWRQEDHAKIAWPNKGTGWGLSSLFKPEFFWKIGGYLENYQEWGAEDQDICKRARAIDNCDPQIKYQLTHLFHWTRQKGYEKKDDIIGKTSHFPKQISARLAKANAGKVESRTLISLDNLESEDVSCYG